VPKHLRTNVLEQARKKFELHQSTLNIILKYSEHCLSLLKLDTEQSRCFLHGHWAVLTQ